MTTEAATAIVRKVLEKLGETKGNHEERED